MQGGGTQVESNVGTGEGSGKRGCAGDGSEIGEGLGALFSAWADGSKSNV